MANVLSHRHLKVRKMRRLDGDSTRRRSARRASRARALARELKHRHDIPVTAS